MNIRIPIFVLLFGAALGLRTLAAAELSPSAGNPILEISGLITNSNANDAEDNPVARFDLESLRQMKQVALKVETPWTDGTVTFRGPLLSDLLNSVGATGRHMRATALNDYVIDIPVSDVESYPVILALERDGAQMRVRDKGPIWVIYPWRDFEELRTELYYGRSIWQLKSIRVQ